MQQAEPQRPVALPAACPPAARPPPACPQPQCQEETRECKPTAWPERGPGRPGRGTPGWGPPGCGRWLCPPPANATAAGWHRGVAWHEQGCMGCWHAEGSHTGCDGARRPRRVGAAAPGAPHAWGSDWRLHKAEELRGAGAGVALEPGPGRLSYFSAGAGGRLPGNKICFSGRAVLLSFCSLQGGGERGLSACGLRGREESCVSCSRCWDLLSVGVSFAYSLGDVCLRCC